MNNYVDVTVERLRGEVISGTGIRRIVGIGSKSELYYIACLVDGKSGFQTIATRDEYDTLIGLIKLFNLQKTTRRKA